MHLKNLVDHLQQALGILHKQDIQAVSQFLAKSKLQSPLNQPQFNQNQPQSQFDQSTTSPLVGDDCAAIADGSGYLLLAAEGMLPQLVEKDPWFAGWCAVMVNVSDIYAMGGRPIAVVDTIWSQANEVGTQVLEAVLAGMQAAAQTYGVPIVGGHTNNHSTYNALSVAILGRAQSLLSGFQARSPDLILLVADFRGQTHPDYLFWNAATTAPPDRLRGDLELLPTIAEQGLCRAGKDVSMGGIVGTLLMLLETSRCGAMLDLDSIPCPETLPFIDWLLCFPSYGFLLSIPPANILPVQKLFQERNLVCAVIGEICPGSQLQLQQSGESLVFWDLAQQPLTGFGR